MLSQGNSSRRGSVANQVAVALPLVAYVCIVGADWARLIHYQVSAQNCARAGAMHAAGVDQDASAHGDLTTVALAEAPWLAAAPSVDTTDTLVGGRPAVRVTVSVPFTATLGLPGGPPTQVVKRSLLVPVLATVPDYAGN